jgi:hypothetical protein
MGKKYKSKRVWIKKGQSCPRCRQTMDRFKHADHWVPPTNGYWFTWWDVCPKCRHVQHYEHAKCWPGQGRPPVEHLFREQDPKPVERPKPSQDIVMDVLNDMNVDYNPKEPPW